MASGSKLASKRKATTNKMQLKKKGPDESDEDYMVSEDEEIDVSDGYFSSLADDETEESLREFEEGEEELEKHVKKKIKKGGRPRGRKSSQGRNGAVKPRNKNAAYIEEEGKDCDDDDFSGKKGRKKSMVSSEKEGNDDIGALCRQEDDFGEVKPRKRSRISSASGNVNHCVEKPRNKSEVSYKEETEDGDFNDFDKDGDEEFMPDEVDCDEDDDDVYNDDELHGMKNNKVNRLRMQEARRAKGKKQKRNFKALKATERKKTMKEHVRRKYRYHNKEFRDEGPVAKKAKSSAKNSRGRGRSNASSDSDFVTPGLSDYEYTIPDDGREQIREASEFCRRLTTSLRSSSSLEMTEEETVPSEVQCPGRKGKEKMVDLQIKIVKQVCGICLSEEGKRIVRGILDCCSHYFCFACIMEWSKVESRCPLCKQRFTTISRIPHMDSGHDSSDVVIPVPERDQVYLPSEEELRGYLDPYENVICTVCHQGGDDALMLLCDICDSPSHTYCVGLGREVPGGNWYCDGCRPAELACSNAQALNPSPNQEINNNFPFGSPAVDTVRETFDLNELHVTETPLSQETGCSPSPRHSIGDSQAASLASGSGAFTLYERRRIQREIQRQIYLLNYRNRQSEHSDGVALVSGIGLFDSQVFRDAIERLQAVPVQVAPQNQGRLSDYITPSLYEGEVRSARSISLTGMVFDHRASTSMNHTLCRPSQTELSGTNAMMSHHLDHQQFRPCKTVSNTGANASISPIDMSRTCLQKEHVQSMVRSHLKGLSRNLDIDYITFKSIARSSTHTILAALGLEHRAHEVYPIRTRLLICDHLNGIASQQTYPIAGQCSSCFYWFVGNVVGEIFSSRLPLLSKD